MYRETSAGLEVFIIHPGGPYFVNKDEGWWSIPKGLGEIGEDPLDTARREFKEETGLTPPEENELIPLGSVKQKGGKTVYAWGFKVAPDIQINFESNTFEMEWPRGSGQMMKFPEANQACFFPLDLARKKINSAQAEFVDRLEEKLNN